MPTRMVSLRQSPVYSVKNSVVFGNQRPKQFLSELANGVSSLDIIIIGDSNTGFAPAGMWGYHHGFQEAMNLKGWACYGTPVVPILDDYTLDYYIDTWNSFINNKKPGAVCLSGNTSGGSTAYSGWSPGISGSLTYVRYGSTSSTPVYKQSWAYITNTGANAYQDHYHSIGMQSAHPLANNTLTLYYRGRYGTFSTGSGKFQPNVRSEFEASPWTITQLQRSAVINTNSGASSFATWDFSFTPRNGESVRASPFGDGNSQSAGPIAIHSHSIYARRKGWAVHAHGYFAGYTSTEISNQVGATGSTLLQTQLQEIRERQIQAGGTGRVLLMLHSGINGNDTGSTWTAAHIAVWNTYKVAWSALGYPASDLAVVSWVGVPRNSDDSSSTGASGNLIAVRASANAMVQAQSDMTVVDVKQLMNYAQANRGTGGGRSYYSTANSVHLSGGYTSGTFPTGTRDTSDGYTIVADAMLNALLTS